MNMAKFETDQIKKEIKSIFPIRLDPYEDYSTGRVTNPSGWDNIFHENKPKGLAWFAFGLTILKPDLIEFRVYDMKCFATGGLGKLLDTFEVEVHPDVTRRSIKQKVRDAAYGVLDQVKKKEDHIRMVKYYNRIMYGINKEG